MYWQIPKMWLGETAYLIGGGKSLETVNDWSVLHRKRVIAVNQAFELGPWDFVYFQDCIWFDDNEEALMKFGGIKVTTCLRTDLNPNIMTVKHGGDITYDSRPGFISLGGNSGYGAVMLAIKLGVKVIYLLGFDMKTTAGEHNYHKKHSRQAKGQIPEDIYERDFMHPFARLAKIYKSLGVEIYNANLDSAMDYFPKVDREEVLDAASLMCA